MSSYLVDITLAVKHWREEGLKLSNEVKGMNPYEEKAMEMREIYDRRRSRKGNGHDDHNGELSE
jgi:hypothetical protein